MHPLVRLTFGEYQIASVTLAADAQALHDYSVEIYGDGIFPEGTTIAWATSFPTGHLLMWKQRRLIGEFGLAPLHPKDAENLLVATCWASDIIPMTEAEARLARPLY